MCKRGFLFHKIFSFILFSLRLQKNGTHCRIRTLTHQNVSTQASFIRSSGWLPADIPVLPFMKVKCNLTSWSRPRERACLRLLATVPLSAFPGPRLIQKKGLRVSLPVARERLQRGSAARRGCRAGAGRRLGGPEPSLRTEGAALPSPAQRTSRRELSFIPAKRARPPPVG